MLRWDSIRSDRTLDHPSGHSTFIQKISWSVPKQHQLVNFVRTVNCDEMLSHFIGLVSNGVNSIIPKKYVKVRANEPPWITSKFKSLLKKRQDALANNNKVTFNYYRNLINRYRKSCRAKYYENKVKDLNESNPRNWWSYVKSLSGMATPRSDIFDILKIPEIDTQSTSRNEIANVIN